MTRLAPVSQRKRDLRRPTKRLAQRQGTQVMLLWSSIRYLRVGQRAQFSSLPLTQVRTPDLNINPLLTTVARWLNDNSGGKSVPEPYSTAALSNPSHTAAPRPFTAREINCCPRASPEHNNVSSPHYFLIVMVLSNLVFSSDLTFSGKRTGIRWSLGPFQFEKLAYSQLVLNFHITIICQQKTYWFFKELLNKEIR